MPTEENSRSTQYQREENTHNSTTQSVGTHFSLECDTQNTLLCRLNHTADTVIVTV